MKPADDIERYFQNATLNTNPQAHERIFADVFRVHEHAIADSPARPERWRIAMRHPVTKYALAAAIVLVATVGFSLFYRTGNAAWAIEESIQALSKYNALLVEGLSSELAWEPDGSPEMRPSRWWAVANADQTGIEKYRFEFDGVTRLITDGHKTWKYEPQAHRVTIKNQPYVASECWPGSRLLEQLKEFREAGILTHWQEKSGKDPATGEARVFLHVAWVEARWNGPRSVRFVFDPDSKLLVGMRQWENANWEDPPTVVMEKITHYESLPDDLFEFQIPPGAKVVER